MERVCEELDEAKAEIEQLAADLKCKNELYNKLKRTHSDQLVQIRDASLKMEKQAQELNEKTEENYAMKQICEDLRCSLKEKESIIRNLSTANDRLRVDCGEKDRKWEGEKRGLVLALDEANEKNIDHEQRINVLLAEIEGLKGHLSTSENKCKEAAVTKLEIELENCYSFIMQLKMQHVEASVMLLVLKSGITEAQLNLGNTEAEMIICDKERDENVSVLKKQLEKKNDSLDKALIDLEKERNNAEALMRRVESLDLIDEKRQEIQKELERYKEMLEESSRCQLSFKEQALQTEIYLREKVREVCDALDRANWELTREREKAGSLLKRAECFDFIKEKWILMQTEFQRYQELLEESSRCQLQLEEMLYC